MPVYRLKYSKEGPARYISHLDLLRTFARAGRRAGLPLAFTQGFNPHPKITFAAPLSVGIAGLGEFADIELTGYLPDDDVRIALSSSLPEGLRILEARTVPMPVKSLMAAVERAVYRASAVLGQVLSQEELTGSVNAFLDLHEIWTERRGKKAAAKKYNIREGIFSLKGTIEGDVILLEMEIKTGSSGNVRCEEVLTEFIKAGGLTVTSGFDLSRTVLYQVSPCQREQRELWL